MPDETEPYRRQRLAEINSEPGSREALEAQHGQVWNTEEMSRDFEVIGFMAPYVVARRKGDGKKGRWSSSINLGFTLASEWTNAGTAITSWDSPDCPGTECFASDCPE